MTIYSISLRLSSEEAGHLLKCVIAACENKEYVPDRDSSLMIVLASCDHETKEYLIENISTRDREFIAECLGNKGVSVIDRFNFDVVSAYSGINHDLQIQFNPSKKVNLERSFMEALHELKDHFSKMGGSNVPYSGISDYEIPLYIIRRYLEIHNYPVDTKNYIRDDFESAVAKIRPTITKHLTEVDRRPESEIRVLLGFYGYINSKFSYPSVPHCWHKIKNDLEALQV